jgi:hypothetical protein
VCRKHRFTTNDAVCRRFTMVIPLVARPENALALVESCVALDSGRGMIAAIAAIVPLPSSRATHDSTRARASSYVISR